MGACVWTPQLSPAAPIAYATKWCMPALQGDRPPSAVVTLDVRGSNTDGSDTPSNNKVGQFSSEQSRASEGLREGLVGARRLQKIAWSPCFHGSRTLAGPMVGVRRPLNSAPSCQLYM